MTRTEYRLQPIATWPIPEDADEQARYRRYVWASEKFQDWLETRPVLREQLDCLWANTPKNQSYSTPEMISARSNAIAVILGIATHRELLRICRFTLWSKGYFGI